MIRLYALYKSTFYLFTYLLDNWLTSNMRRRPIRSDLSTDMETDRAGSQQVVAVSGESAADNGNKTCPALAVDPVDTLTFDLHLDLYDHLN